MDSFFLIIFYVLTPVAFIIAALAYYFILRERKFRDISSALHLKLYKILLPEDMPDENDKGNNKNERVFLAMEQLYSSMTRLRRSGLRAIIYGRPIVTFEIAVSEAGKSAVIYAALPGFFVSTFEKLFHSLFPGGRMEHADDYNVFNSAGVSMASYLKLGREAVFQIHTYKKLGQDPFSIIAGAFAKLKGEGEGAAIQFVVRPAKEPLNALGKKVAKAIRSGSSVKEALSDSKGISPWFHEFGIFFGLVSPKKKSSENDSTLDHKPDEETASMLEEKASMQGFDVNVRLIASSFSEDGAERILRELEAVFMQFAEPQGNSFEPYGVKGKSFDRLVYLFSFRMFNPLASMYLSSAELATIFHFPYGGTDVPHVQFLKSKQSPCPNDLPAEGILLGENLFRGTGTPINMARDDRRRHIYVIGQTGTGKTVLLKNMIKQDIESGNGVCFIDPHGDDVKEVLGYIPKERIEDVIYFDPADMDRPMGLNFLEYDPSYPEQKTFIVNELIEIFDKLYNLSQTGGPMFEQYFRNAALLVMEDPPSGNTLMEIERVLTDKAFRDMKLSRTSNIVVRTFWKQIAEKAGGESSLQNMVPYITSKFDTFLANEIMRPIIAQESSAFKLREVIDNKKILLINLSKGRLGELNSNLLGLILVGKIMMAALSREDIQEEKRSDFYLYIDEFQNITTKSIATILSEARKYKLNMVIAHQFIGQLAEEIQKAVFGNVGTTISFRIGTEDAKIFKDQFDPVVSESDLINVDNWNAYVKMLVRGKPTRAFSMKTYPPAKGNDAAREAIRNLSRLKYGRSRSEIETEIIHRYEKFG